MRRFRMRSLLVALLVAATGFTGGLSSTSSAAADTVQMGRVDATTATAPKVKVFPVDVPAPASITATLDWTSVDANLTLILKAPDGSKVAQAATKQNPERLTFAASMTGIYKFNVIAASGASDFTLSVTMGAAQSGPTLPRFIQAIGRPAHPDIAPSGLDVDPAGNVYAASTANDEIVKYSPSAAVLWHVGNRDGRRDGNFSNPRDTAYYGGRVFVADTGYNRVQVLDASTGSWLATWPTRFSANLGISAGVDGSGKPIILVSDSTANAVKIFSPDGTYLRMLGTGGAGSAQGQFNQVRDAATDTAGNIYTADFKNERVQVFSPGGVFLRAFGSACPGICPAPTPGQFKDPYGIQLDDAGNVYVSDNRRIQKFTASGGYLGSYGTSGSGSTQLSQLRRVAVGRGLNPAVYAADLWGYKILEFDQSGSLTHTFGGGLPAATGFNQPYGLSLNGDTLYVADTNNQRIQLFSASTGSNVGSFGGRGFGKDNLNGVNWPRGVTYNAFTNTIWVADTKNYRVVEHSVDGTPTGRVFGTTGSVLMPSILNWVYGITSYGSDVIVADTFGNKIGRWTGNDATTPLWTYTGVQGPKAVSVVGDTVYVADSLNHRVVILNAKDGTLLNILGDTVLHRVEGIAVAPDGSIWVADTSANQLVQLDAAGKVLQTFGRFGANTGQFNLPTQLLISGSGTSTRLYVTDTNNDRVQVFDIS